MLKSAYLKKCYDAVVEKNSDQKEFLQAVTEFLQSVEPVILSDSKFEEAAIIERLLIPERLLKFKVNWIDRNGKINVNTGYRVQFNSAIGPYKGGLRFHPSVTESVIKFLGFEQIFKNSLTGLMMGGGKGGSDFDPKDKTDAEVLSFCQNFMLELSKHIGQFTDVPAGDIGVGAREVGFMFGYYKKLKNEFTGTLTGKGLAYGGSLVRKEATGFGTCYFMQAMLKEMRNDSFKGKKVVISGSGNVAIYAAYKAVELGATVVAMSDSKGYIFSEKGICIDVVKQLKEVDRKRISEYTKIKGDAQYIEGHKNIWDVKCDIALPCATQNELDEDAAKTLVLNNVIAVAEGANMPTTPKAIEIFLKNGVCFGPSKAANAGGVAVSGIEMMQNSTRDSLSFFDVDEKLKEIMKNIFENSYKTSEIYGKKGDLVMGANIAGFNKVADAMIAQGI